MNAHIEKVLKDWAKSLERYGHIDCWNLNEKVNCIGNYIKSNEDTCTIRSLVSNIRNLIIKGSYKSDTILKMINNVLKKVNNSFTEKSENIYRVLPGQSVRFKEQTYKLFDEKLKFKKGQLLRNFDIEIEAAKDSRIVRRIVEKRMSQAYYKMNCKNDSDHEKSRNHKYWMQRATAYQLYNIGQIEHVKDVQRSLSTHWKRVFDPFTGEIVFKKKMAYANYQDALDAIQLWHINHPNDSGKMQAYKCTECKKWHIGHSYTLSDTPMSCNMIHNYSLVC